MIKKKKKPMSNDKIKKENTKKRRYQLLLTFQIYNPGHQTESTMHEKTA
jgi:hypothetical protein